MLKRINFQKLELVLITMIFITSIFACQNTYNNLIPKDGKDVLSFSVTTKDGEGKSTKIRINGNFVMLTAFLKAQLFTSFWQRLLFHHRRE